MKYIATILLVLIAIQFFYPKVVANEAGDERQVIPDEAIRLRILANSNSDEDQEIKHDVRDAVSEQITEWVEELTSIEKARQTIQENIPELEELVGQHVGDQDFQVEFGPVEFPDKIYDNYIYPGGTYEAVLITIGEGEGDNWWCVLFPPLCFVDFSNGATVLEHDEDEAEESDDEPEVKFFLWEWIKGIISFFT